MDSHVLRKAAYRLPALAGLAVLRFNTRGTTSRAGHQRGRVRRRRRRAARRRGRDRLRGATAGCPDAGWWAGRSAPSWPCAGAATRRSTGAILLSPPLRRAGDADLDAWAASGKPLLALVPEFDDYLRPDEARARFARVPQAEVVGVDGAKHLWVGERYMRIVLERDRAPGQPGRLAAAHGRRPRLVAPGGPASSDTTAATLRAEDCP